MLTQTALNDLFTIWSKIKFSKLLYVDQRNEAFLFEFILDDGITISKLLLSDIQNITIKKDKPGNVSWLSHWGV